MMTITRDVAEEQVELFASLIWDPSDLIEIRILPKRERIYTLAGQLVDHVDRLWELNQDGQNIYVGINPRSRKGGKAEDVKRFRTFFVDWDGVSLEYIQHAYDAAGVADPTLVVASGHGYHAYWRLDEDAVSVKEMDASTWSAYQRGLIAALNSDPAIKDPSRIMRLPGFLNTKSDEQPPCKVQWYDDESVYVPDDINADPLFAQTIPSSDGMSHPIPADDEPHPATLDFIANGAPDGKRNYRLFNAACDLAARNYGHDEIKKLLTEPAMRSGLQLFEIERTVESALSQPRTPRETAEVDVKTSLDRMAGGTQTEHEKAAETGDKFKGILSNIVYIDDKKDSKKKVPVYVSIKEIADLLQKGTNKGLMRFRSGILFAVRDNLPTLPETDAIRTISSTEDLFGWCHEKMRVRWLSGRDVIDRDTSDTLTAVNRAEFYSHCKSSIEPSYLGVELLPHVPSIKDYLYVHGELPESDGSALAEISERLNFATEEDRDLMLAALFTPAWGGPPGARPAFLFMNSMASQIGVGAGKSTTAALIAKVWGGFVSIRGDDQWSEVTKRLLSDDGLAKRCVLIDNIKGNLSSSQLESGITATDIDGHRMYHGQARRRNTLNWYLTANTPDLSRDLADRCVLIHVGAPKHASDFSEWNEWFMSNRRAALIADIMATMSGPAKCTIETKNKDRWSLWQQAVLSRFKNGNELAQIIQKRRPEVDADLDQANEIADVVKAMLEKGGFDWNDSKVAIGKSDLFHQIRDYGMAFKSSNGLTRKMHQLKGMGDLKHLTESRSRSEGRQWLWVGPNASDLTPTLTLRMNRNDGELPL